MGYFRRKHSYVNLYRAAKRRRINFFLFECAPSSPKIRRKGSDDSSINRSTNGPRCFDEHLLTNRLFKSRLGYLDHMNEISNEYEAGQFAD